jgi:hypothetical protein
MSVQQDRRESLAFFGGPAEPAVLVSLFAGVVFPAGQRDQAHLVPFEGFSFWQNFRTF